MAKQSIILLDLGGVVFQSTGISNEKIHWQLISQLNHKYGHELNIGKDLFSDFLLEYNDQSDQNLSGKEFLKCVFDTLEINRELIEFIGSRSQIIIVSDNYRENIEYISKRYKFHQWAIGQIYSFDYKMVKSNPLFFEKLKAELSMYSIDQMIFIDDSPEKLKSAAQSGIKGLLFQNNEQIISELKEIDN